MIIIVIAAVAAATDWMILPGLRMDRSMFPIVLRPYRFLLSLFFLFGLYDQFKVNERC